MSWKKVRSNDPEYYMESGTRTAMQLAPFVTVPLEIPKRNVINSVIIGKKKSGIFVFKPMKSAHFSPSKSDPKNAGDFVFDASKIKVGDGWLIGKESIIKNRPAIKPDDYNLFMVKSIDMKGKDMSVCLVKTSIPFTF